MERASILRSSASTYSLIRPPTPALDLLQARNLLTLARPSVEALVRRYLAVGRRDVDADSRFVAGIGGDVTVSADVGDIRGKNQSALSAVDDSFVCSIGESDVSMAGDEGDISRVAESAIHVNLGQRVTPTLTGHREHCADRR